VLRPAVHNEINIQSAETEVYETEKVGSLNGYLLKKNKREERAKEKPKQRRLKSKTLVLPGVARLTRMKANNLISPRICYSNYSI
jgi:hypothetical protein